ncbi:MAG: adenylate/guanylate cyclase domain-containing protein [Candidatus Eremiobacteraeota bacterium]|nr:adenylate/guanylate cyclase domain-containing protein [Candidatus Eremiobacteraeota bacterium]
MEIISPSIADFLHELAGEGERVAMENYQKEREKASHRKVSMAPGKTPKTVRRPLLPFLLLGVMIGFLGYWLTTLKIGHYFDIAGIYDHYERQLLYNRFEWRAENKNYPLPLDDRIAIIAIDDRSLDNDRLPLIYWNKYYVPVFSMLLEGGARVIGFDVYQGLSIEESLQQILDEKAFDAAKEYLKKGFTFDEWRDDLLPELPISKKDNELAMLLMEKKKIILPCQVLSGKEIVRPIDLIALASGRETWGVVTLPTFPDGVVIFNQFSFLWKPHANEERTEGNKSSSADVSEENSETLYSFAVRILEKFSGSSLEMKSDGASIGKLGLPLDSGQRLWINYRRPVDYQNDKTIAYSFIDVLKKASNNDAEFFKENFEGRIVLIGCTSLAMGDMHKSPYIDASGDLLKLPGIEIHGHTLSTILQQDFLTLTPPAYRCLIFVFLCLLSSLMAARTRPLVAVILNGLLMVTYIAITFGLFFFRSIWVDTLAAFIIIPNFAALSLYRYYTEEREREKLRKIFGRYVSKNVMEAITGNPKLLALGGSRRKVTILFSDINNFTPTSEGLTPEELIGCLNSYFKEMNAIIMKYNGTIKQFVGDEIMVIYGAPVDQDDQAVRAVNTALEMVDRLNEMKAAAPTGKAGFYEVKIGIHTGEVVAGNVGSEDRTEYAAVGDNVNLTSRIEGLNKKLGTFILISEETYSEVNGKVENVAYVPFPPQEVKGKKKLLTVFEVKRPVIGGKNEENQP